MPLRAFDVPAFKTHFSFVYNIEVSVSNGVANPSTNSYTYNSMNQLTAISGGESSTFDYDVFGNMLSQTKDGFFTAFSYDRLNRQIKVDPQNFATNTSTYYGASGLRQSSTKAGVTTNFIHDGNTCVSAGDTTYFVPGSTPLWETSNGGTLVYGTERGNVTALVGTNGVQTKFSYDAFGNISAKNNFNQPVANSSGPRFNGYFLDASENQYATGWRPYRPDIGRFSSLDPAGSPNGPNRYNYCSSEPVNQSDPTGTIIKFRSDGSVYGPENIDYISMSRPIKKTIVNEMMCSQLVFTFDSVAQMGAILEKRDKLARYHNLAMGLDESTPYLDGAIEGTEIVRNTAVTVGAVAATGGLAVSAGAAYAAGGATGLVVFGAETAVTVKAAGLVSEGAQAGLRAAGVDEDFVAPVADVVTAGVMAVPVKRLLTPKTNSSAAPTRSRSPTEPAEEQMVLEYGKPSAPRRGPKTNPDAPHNAKIREVGNGGTEYGVKPGETLIAGGGRYRERLRKTPGGFKTGRRPDVLIQKADGTMRGVNVGKTDATGRPVLREAEAMADLEQYGKTPTDFVPYDE